MSKKQAKGIETRPLWDYWTTLLDLHRVYLKDLSQVSPIVALKCKGGMIKWIKQIVGIMTVCTTPNIRLMNRMNVVGHFNRSEKEISTWNEEVLRTELAMEYVLKFNTTDEEWATTNRLKKKSTIKTINTEINGELSEVNKVSNKANNKTM